VAAAKKAARIEADIEAVIAAGRKAAAARVAQEERDQEAQQTLDDAKRLERQAKAYNTWKRERDAAQDTDAVRYAKAAVEKAERDAAKRKTDHTLEFILAVTFLIIFILLVIGA
jgi:hypothetical protein